MKAVILAGGKGTRLKPYTTVIPKPLVPIGERAILDILLHQLKKYNITDVTICVNHFAEIIKAFFGNGQKIGMKITYSEEESPLGTVAPLKMIHDLPENFLVMNGDLLTDMNFQTLFDQHTKNRANLTVSTYVRDANIDFGVIEMDPEHKRIENFKEKPVYSFIVSMGVYAMSKRILNYVPDHAFGFDDLIHKLLSVKEEIQVFPYSGYWLDIGRPDDYDKANNDLPTIEGFLS